MKPIHIITTISFIIFFIANCTTKMAVQSTKPVNYEIKDNNGNVALLGKSTRERLAQPPFDTWFTKNYAGYTIDTSSAMQLKPFAMNKKFLLFMGTWCGDSRREVPRIYKLLDFCGVKPAQVQLINVSNDDTAYKQSPGGEEKGLNIHRVPSLLIFENNHELGRVVESPVASWEKDVLAIVSGQSYEPRYKAVPRLAKLLQQSSLQTIQNNLPQIAYTLKPLVSNRGELLAYGKLLLALHQTDKAICTMELNSLLFATDAEVWNGLATAWYKTGNIPNAVTYYRKAIALQPGNAMATAMLKQLGEQ